MQHMHLFPLPQLYIYLLSRLTRGETNRNFYLLNKTE